jgi:hypothetical protein
MRFPLSFKADLKEFYVGVTRAKAKLFIVELHPKSPQAQNPQLVSRVSRELVDRELAGISEILPRAMLPEEWLQRGLLFCIAATSDDPDVARPNLNRAIRAFEKGGGICQDFLRRASCLLQYWTDRETVLRSNNSGRKKGNNAKGEHNGNALSVACDSASELFEAGLLREASGILSLLDLTKIPSHCAATVLQMQERIALLSSKYKNPLSPTTLLVPWCEIYRRGQKKATSMQFLL